MTMSPQKPPQPSAPPYPGSGLSGTPGQALIGMILPFAGQIDPVTFLLDRKTGNPNEILNFGPTVQNNTGWILCSGSQVYAANFPRLFNTIGYLYGKGDKEGMFMVPDYRGYFLRALDTANDPHNLDPGLDKRNVYGTGKHRKIKGSTGTATGAGSVEDTMVQMHQHHYDNYPGYEPVPPPPPPPSPSIAAQVQEEENETYDLLIDNKVIPETDAKESRPVNIYVNYLIYSGIPGK